MRILALACIAAVVLSFAGCGGSSGSATAGNDAPAGATSPVLGSKAPDFSLSTLDGKAVHLAELNVRGPVVVVQLRGWVGYQCPLCTKQVGDLVSRAAAFAAAGARVVLVYPGAADQLDANAKEFIAGKGFPDGFDFVTDPGLAFVSAWGLRWNAEGETAYPAAYVIDKQGIVKFAKVSDSHGGRASADEILAALGN